MRATILIKEKKIKLYLFMCHLLNKFIVFLYATEIT